MVCKVNELSLEERLSECPEILVDAVNEYLARWNEKGYNAKVIQVEVDDTLYKVTGHIYYRVFVEWLASAGVFTIFSCHVNSSGRISGVFENCISAYDIQTIMEHSKHFATKDSSGS